MENLNNARSIVNALHFVISKNFIRVKSQLILSLSLSLKEVEYNTHKLYKYIFPQCQQSLFFFRLTKI